MARIRFDPLGLGTRAVPYEQGWAEQRRRHAARVRGEIADTCLLLEHPAVYTAGRRTDPSERPLDGTPVIDVDRGGKITWHGPGQLVGYPIVRLAEPVDVVGFVRQIEAGLIEVCAALGVRAERVPGRSGVWLPARPTGPSEQALPERKIAAIGLRVAHGVTMHGFALNCSCDLSAYARIVPCGIRDARVTSLSTELGREVTVTEVAPLVERHLGAALSGCLAAGSTTNRVDPVLVAAMAQEPG
ncbi:MAG: lipoyl(octanoyl) transferase LipB [Actinomycetes bacterium]